MISQMLTGHSYVKYRQLLHTQTQVQQCTDVLLYVPVLLGTGSGIGTYILSLLKDDYPEIFRSVARQS